MHASARRGLGVDGSVRVGEGGGGGRQQLGHWRLAGHAAAIAAKSLAAPQRAGGLYRRARGPLQVFALAERARLRSRCAAQGARAVAGGAALAANN